MRVMCINDKWRHAPGAAGRPAPQFGEDCDVVDSGIVGGHYFYTLGGRFMEDSLFHCSHFSLISDLDEVKILADRFGMPRYR